MNKKDFEAFLKGQMSTMSYSNKRKTLLKMQEAWIPAILKEFAKKEGYYVEPKDRDKYLYCNQCKRYSLVKNVKAVQKIVTETSSYGEMTYMRRYMLCPKCNKRTIIGNKK